ncbi:TKL protein kinase [Saprolegnia diclina VS20]|uniref:TKL protein kinase n=1 Tax=Saprolegnia diclina (strain VS20) TaxID=1156394 RepID=T0Q0Z8_SAPDV|nr:TKL protein kinase [Saprolegnia diclina VS20]EQC27025.1 TKL protein kinase [Saprolegnia diclina VS20]|eukprot:XP_008619525.1 TKL protein kinase [Saprolegnia diclina VS20]
MTKSKEEELYTAAEEGRLGDVKRLVEKEGVNPNGKDGAPLGVAAWFGQAKVVCYLLTKGASTEGHCNDGLYTPLLESAKHNRLEVARLLLDADADPGARNIYKETALDVAIKYRHDDVAQLLRDHPQRKITKAKLLAALHERCFSDAITLIKSTTVDVNLRDGNFVPLLQLVVDTGDMALLQTLLSKPSLDVNATDKEEQTALTRAIAKNNIAAVVALVQANARGTLMGEEGWTVQMYHFGLLLLQAASTNNAGNLEVLLRAGARPSTVNEDGATALHVAAANGHDDIVTLLLATDPSLSCRSDQSGNLPLHLAAAKGHMFIVEKLVQHAPVKSLSWTNSGGCTPLSVAIKCAHAPLVSLLIQSGTSLDSTTNSGWTLLHEAAATGGLAMVKMLLSTTLNMFAKTTAGETPLQIATDKQRGDAIVQAFKDAEAAETLRFLDAVQSGDADRVDVYLRKGVGVNTTDANGRTALHVAVARDHASVVDRLVRAGATIVVHDANGTSPLLLSARQGHVASAHVLVQALSLEALASSVRWSYAEAMDKGHTEVAEMLLPHLPPSVVDPYPEAAPATDEDTSRRDALLAIFRTALDGAGSDAMNQTLVQAVLAGHADAVQCLLAMGADPATMRPEQHGWTLLALAIKQANDAVAQVLYPHLYPEPTAAIATELVVEREIFGGTGVTVNLGSYGDKAVVMKGPKLPNPRLVKSFMQEVDTMRTCTSPYLQPLLAVLDNGSQKPHVVRPRTLLYSPTMVMEYMELGDLHNYLQLKQFGVPVEMELSTIEVALVLALALADLHRCNVVHRDVKSLNIFLSKTYYVRLGDLGSARTLDGDTFTSNVGTKFWMAPEVLRVPDLEGQGRVYTTAADIYSFGVVLTELDTLCEPYSDLVDRNSIEAKVRTGLLRPNMSPTCPRWLQDLADKCLAFDPTERPTAAAIVKELLLRRNDGDDAPTTVLMNKKAATSAVGLPTISECGTNSNEIA